MANISSWRAEKGSKNLYKVPKEEQEEYKLFIQRANRRIKQSYKYIQENDIKSWSTQRALMGQFADIFNWETRSNPLSRGTKFKDRETYEDFREFVDQWGAKTSNYDKSPASVRAEYRKSIINTLNRTIIKNQIPTENGQIPKQILNRLNRMTLTQLVNFYGDEFAEEMENHRFDSDGRGTDGSGKRNVEAGDLDSFVNYINKQIDWVRSAYPENRTRKTKRPKKTKKSKSIKNPKNKRSKSIVKKPKEYLNHTKFKEKL